MLRQLKQGVMLPVFIYWFYVQITGNTVFKKGMAFTNVLLIFGILKVISMLMPVNLCYALLQNLFAVKIFDRNIYL